MSYYSGCDFEDTGHPCDLNSKREGLCDACGAYMARTGQLTLSQDQRSLMDQMNDLMQLAVNNGLYDAHDWLLARLNNE